MPCRHPSLSLTCVTIFTGVIVTLIYVTTLGAEPRYLQGPYGRLHLPRPLGLHPPWTGADRSPRRSFGAARRGHARRVHRLRRGATGVQRRTRSRPPPRALPAKDRHLPTRRLPQGRLRPAPA